jgi:hypothetical protein
MKGNTIISQVLLVIIRLIGDVTVWPNPSYIVPFGPYRPHGFVSGDASPLLSLTPQNVYDKLATNTLNKVSYHSLTRRCEILQSTPLKEPDDPINTTRQPVRSALKPNVIAQPSPSPTRHILSALGLTTLMVLFLVTRAHF